MPFSHGEEDANAPKCLQQSLIWFPEFSSAVTKLSGETHRCVFLVLFPCDINTRGEGDGDVQRGSCCWPRLLPGLLVFTDPSGDLGRPQG